MNSIQLSVRGKPSAFDLSPSNDVCAVASPGCIAFFHLHGLGSPRHVIHYEQPHQIRQLRFQRSNQQILSALRGGSISLWDPSKLLRPLNGFIRSKGWITEMEWAYNSPYLLATGCDGGDFSVWDIRTISKPIQTMNVSSVVNQVEWSPISSTSSLGIPTMSSSSSSASSMIGGFNVLTVHGDTNVSIWDLRMTSSGGSNSNMNSSTNSRVGGPLISMVSPDPILRAMWSFEENGNSAIPNNNNSNNTPAIVIAKASGYIEWWEIQGCEFRQHSSILSPQLDGNNSLFLATSVGRGLVYTSRHESQGSGAASTGTNTPLGDGVTKIHLQGYARDNKNLERIFRVPNSNSGTNNSGNSSSGSSNTTNNNNNACRDDDHEVLTSGPRITLATVSDQLLGFRWGTPGRLVPPSHSGLELLFLTESARLHAIKVPADVVQHYCGGIASAAVSCDPGKLLMNAKSTSISTSGVATSSNTASGGATTSSANNSSANTSGTSNIGNASNLTLNPSNTIGSMDGTGNNIAESAFTPIPAPTPLGCLRSSWLPGNITLTNANLLKKIDSGVSLRKMSFMSDSDLMNKSGHNNNNQQLSATTSPFPSSSMFLSTSPDESFWASLQNEVLVLEDQIQKGNFPGLVIGRIDQYARQVTLDMHVPQWPRGGTNGNGCSNGSDANLGDSGSPVHTTSSTTSTPSTGADHDTVSLVIYFPSFPVVGVPSFTIRAPRHSRLDENGSSSSIIHELNTMAKTYAMGMSGSDGSIDGSGTNRKSTSTTPASSSSSTSSSNNRLVNLEISRESKNLAVSGFLTDIARCFRNRVLQPSLTTYHDNSNNDNSSGKTNSNSVVDNILNNNGLGDKSLYSQSSQGLSLEGDYLKALEASDGVGGDFDEAGYGLESPLTPGTNIHQNHFIDPKAYRVPFPPSSGARFGAGGLLACFGGSAVVLAQGTSVGTGQQGVSLGSTPNIASAMAGVDCANQGDLQGGSADSGGISRNVSMTGSTSSVSGLNNSSASINGGGLNSATGSTHLPGANNPNAANSGHPRPFPNQSYPKTYSELLTFMRLTMEAQSLQRQTSMDSNITSTDVGSEDMSSSEDNEGSLHELSHNISTSTASYDNQMTTTRRLKLRRGDSSNSNSSLMSNSFNSNINGIANNNANQQLPHHLQHLESLLLKPSQSQGLDGTSSMSSQGSSSSSSNSASNQVNNSGNTTGVNNSNSNSLSLQNPNSSMQGFGGMPARLKSISSSETAMTPSRIVQNYLNNPKRFVFFDDAEMSNSLESPSHEFDGYGDDEYGDGSNSSMIHHHPSHLHRGGNYDFDDFHSGSGTSTGTQFLGSVFSSSEPLTSTIYKISETLEESLGPRLQLGPIPDGTENCLPATSSGRRCDMTHLKVRQQACESNGLLLGGVLNGTGLGNNKENVVLSLWWSLLSVSLEVYSLPWNSGSLVSWRESSLGCALMYRLVAYARQSRHVISLAAAICILGGSDRVVSLIEPCIGRELDESDSNNSAEINALHIRNPEELEKLSQEDWRAYFDRVLDYYVEMLARQGALAKSTEARKYRRMKECNQEDVNSEELMTFCADVHCSTCGENVHVDTKISDEKSVLWCQQCSRRALYCSLCETPVAGMGLFCLHCGHGGHSHHMKEWFEYNDFCATGCGCYCAHDDQHEQEDTESCDFFDPNSSDESEENITANFSFARDKFEESSASGESTTSDTSSSDDDDDDDDDDSTQSDISEDS